MSNESNPLDWFAEYIPLKERARRGLLADTLLISEIAELHPDGDAFARMLLEGTRIQSHRDASSWSPVEDPPPVARGLRARSTKGHFDRIREIPDLQDDPVTADARNGRYVLVHRDDLKAWLMEIGYWPLRADAELNAWWTADEAQVIPKMERRVKAILEAVKDANIPPMAIPNGGKAAIKLQLLNKYPALFTADTFLKAWHECVTERGVIRMENHEKFSPGR